MLMEKRAERPKTESASVKAGKKRGVRKKGRWEGKKANWPYRRFHYKKEGRENRGLSGKLTLGQRKEGPVTKRRPALKKTTRETGRTSSLGG